MPRTETSALALTADHPIIQFQVELEFDYNNAAKVVVSTALGEVPYVGFLLGALVDIFWPESGQDVWSEIESKVEELVDRKIAERVWQEVSESLAGLHNVTDDYLYAARHFPDDPKVISEKWNVAQGLFLHDLPAFQSKDFELLLLPLFAQFANLHLSLLRDGATFGSTWGWSPTVVDRVREQLAEAISNYTDYTNTIYQAGLENTKRNAPSNKQKTEPFNTINRFEREMTLTVLDFMTMWSYFDLTKYPKPVQVTLDREIYSEAVGTADDTGISLPATPPTQPITTVTVWGWDRIDAVSIDYPDGGGPDGKTSTGRMGNSSGGSNQPPHGGTFAIADTGPVVKVTARTGDIMNAMWLQFENGVTSNELGGNYPGGSDTVWEYPDEILSSIKVMGVSRYYGSANAAVFGFKFKDDRLPSPGADVVRTFFISDPAQPTAADLAAKLGLTGADADEVVRWAEEFGWEQLRLLRVASQKRRAERPGR